MTTAALKAPAAGHRPGAGLGPRLFAAMALVVLAGAGTVLIVALLVAPRIFHAHLRMALGDIPPATQKHVDEAFTSAILVSLGTAVAVALATALTVTWLVSRRIATPVADLAAAVAQLAAGQYHTRVPRPALGPEFTALTDGFNTMAARLAGTEHIRQRLLADLAHELRTPLASVEATVEAVADGVLSADDATWSTLRDQTRRLGRLVEDIAAVSHAEERSLHLDLRSLALHDVAATAAAAVQARYAAKDVTLTVTLDPASPTVHADPDRLAEAVGNLLDNALRHTPSGGTVTVTTHHGTRFGRGTGHLTVIDTGEGFVPAEADHLFERFYRTDAARTRTTAGSGSGIGLTITRAIINAHHGTVHAHSDGPGRGARFEFTLPTDATDDLPRAVRGR